MRFHKEFPTITELEVRIEQDRNRYHTRSRHVRVYTLANHPRLFVPCVNPLCRRGGFDLTDLLITARDAGKLDYSDEVPCNGDEGSPKGRRRGRPCNNWFKVSMRVRCKPET
jgi:hypothetical protein